MRIMSLQLIWLVLLISISLVWTFCVKVGHLKEREVSLLTNFHFLIPILKLVNSKRTYRYFTCSNAERHFCKHYILLQCKCNVMIYTKFSFVLTGSLHSSHFKQRLGTSLLWSYWLAESCNRGRWEAAPAGRKLKREGGDRGTWGFRTLPSTSSLLEANGVRIK